MGNKAAITGGGIDNVSSNPNTAVVLAGSIVMSNRPNNCTNVAGCF